MEAALTPPEPFPALMFDGDGTLVDSVTAYQRAWERAFAAPGRTMAPRVVSPGPGSVRPSSSKPRPLKAAGQGTVDMHVMHVIGVWD